MKLPTFKKEPYEEKTGIFGDAIDYSVYHMSAVQKAVTFACGAAGGYLTGYLFYESILLSLITGLLCGGILLPVRRNYIIKKRRETLLLQFKDALESLNTSIGAGENTTDAFLTAQKDMEYQYSEDSYIARELATINEGICNNINLEVMLLDLSDRSGLEDINSFANVFETCFRKGGNVKEVIKNTYQIICDKIDIAQEIKTMVAAQTNEQHVMMVMPVAFVFLLKMLGDEVIDLTSSSGRSATTVAVVLFVAAFLIGKKILDIKV